MFFTLLFQNCINIIICIQTHNIQYEYLLASYITWYMCILYVYSLNVEYDDKQNSKDKKKHTIKIENVEIRL